MTYITGEQLLLLQAPAEPRRQLQELNSYLAGQGAQSVCTLYGLRRTGKTTLLVQAIQALLFGGVSPDRIGYFIGLKGDDFDDLHLELEARKELLDYIFIDEIGFFSNFLRAGSYLYDTLVRLYNKKVVVTGTNLLALYVAGKSTLYDRCKIIHVPYLSFYEHCRFVLRTEQPTFEQFLAYMKSGGLFKEPEDIPDYIQTSITDIIVELFETQPDSEVFIWLKSENEAKIDWKAYVNTILFLSCNYASNTSLQTQISMVQDFEVLDERISRQVTREFKEYFSLSRNDRVYRMKRTETVALLDFLVHCGLIVVLQNLFDDTEPYKCYLQASFLRFHFTEKPRRMVTGKISSHHKPLFGNLMEATVVSEYLQAHLAASVRFARTHCPSGGDLVAEIDLVDLDAKTGYEVKLIDEPGYRGFQLFSELQELQDFYFELLEEYRCMEKVYQWGEMPYRQK